MNEERRQGYLNLINALLNCPSGEEPQILNANQDLLDAGLLQALAQVAEFLEKRGDRNAADYLRTLANYLPGQQTLGLFSHFLLEVLETIHNSKGSPQVVYQILQENLDKLDENFPRMLRNWATAELPELMSEQAQAIAKLIGDFSLLIQEFPKGTKAINQEIAITGYKIAATVYTLDAFPKDWATIQNNLGNAYCNRIHGDWTENLKKAITAYKDALQVRAPQVLPDEWATTQINLGLAYRQLGQIDEAIGAFTAALRVYTREAFLEKWAKLLHNLSIAYCEKGEIENAIEACLSALHVYTHEAFRTERAGTQNNLGIAYRKIGLISEAIIVLQDALRVYTHEDIPEYWAETTSSLGEAFRDGGQIYQAIECFRSVLKEVFTPQNFPIKCLESGRHLGDIAFSIGQWDEAIEGYGVAIEAVEQSREWASSDTRKEETLSAAIDVYASMVQLCINIGQPDKAIEYVERSKARNLVELLANKDLCPKRDLYPNQNTYQAHCDQVNRLRREIPAQQRALETSTRSRESEERYRNEIERRRQELNHLQQQRDNLLGEINKLDSSFTFTQKVEPISFSDIQALTDDRTAIVQWYITGTQILTFIITRHHPHPFIVSSSPEDMKALEDWANEYLNAYRQQKSLWLTNLASRLQYLAEILHIDEILSRVDDIFSQRGVRWDRLILIPHRFLHLFPLHALPLANGDFLCDRFPNGVGYAPSCQLLQLTQKRERPDFSNFFAIQNPTDDLLYTNLEVESIRSSFPSAQVLVKQAATKTALNASQDLPLAHCNHFSCHGEFNLRSPLESALLLADKERLSLGEIFGLNLNQCRLVTLSACETGLSDPTSVSDEYISLPSGFLYAGSPSVVSSLWAVNDLSTAFLMIKFYENLRNFPKLEAGDVAIALNQAQKWLRDLTSEDFEAVFAKYQPQIDVILAQLSKGDRFEFQDALDQARKQIQAPDRQPKPFANPYYWAAFTATGV